MPQKFFIFILAGFFGGVALRSFFDLGPETALLFLTLGFAFGIIFWFRQGFSGFMLYAAVFMAAFGLGILRYDLRDSREGVKFLEEGIGGRVVLSGEVIEDPQRQDKFTRAVLEADGVKILLTLPHYPEIKYGDILEVSGKLREPENFGEFDWKAYLAKDNIYFEMFLPEIRSQGPGGGWWLKRWLLASKHAFLDNLSKVLPEPHSALMAGLTVGERSGFPAGLEEAFRKVGVIHIVALSGYNISIISDNVSRVLQYLPVTRIFRAALAAFGIILFAVLTGASATVVRASIMGLLLLWAKESGRIYEAMSALFAAAFLMIVVNPKLLVFDVSFQLSFMATLGLILLAPRIEKYFLWFPNFWKLREHLLATISTQIFVLPLLLSIGGTFSWVTIPANLMVLTAVPATMFLGFFAGLAGFLSYGLSQIFSWPAYLFLAYELWVVEIFSKLGS